MRMDGVSLELAQQHDLRTFFNSLSKTLRKMPKV